MLFFLIFPVADAEWRKFHFSDGETIFSSGQFVTAHIKHPASPERKQGVSQYVNRCGKAGT